MRVHRAYRNSLAEPLSWAGLACLLAQVLSGSGGEILRWGAFWKTDTSATHLRHAKVAPSSVAGLSQDDHS